MIFSSSILFAQSERQSNLNVNSLTNGNKLPEESERFRDQLAYVYSKSLCQDDSMLLNLYSESTLNSFGSFSGEKSFRLRNWGYSSKTIQLFKSNGLYLALQECFGLDNARKDAFLKKLLMADFSGFFIGTLSEVLSYGIAVPAVTRWVAGKTIIAALKKSPQLMAWLKKLPKLSQLSVLKITLASTVLSIGFNFYSIWKDQDEFAKAERELSERQYNDLKNIFDENLSTLTKWKEFSGNRGNETWEAASDFVSKFFLSNCDQLITQGTLSQSKMENVKSWIKTVNTYELGVPNEKI